VSGRRVLIAALLLLAAVAAIIASYRLDLRFPVADWWWPPLPGPGSPVYEQYVEAFQLGTATIDARGSYLEVGEKNLTRAIELIPEEPAAWANRGLLYLQTDRPDQAAHDLEQARKLAPADNPGIEKLLGLLHQRRGEYAKAAAHYRKALDLDPHDLEAAYTLAHIIDQQGEGSSSDYQQLMELILADQPNHLPALCGRLKTAVRRSDHNAVRETMTQLKGLLSDWTDERRDALEKLDRMLTEHPRQNPESEMILVINLVMAEPDFRRSIDISDRSARFGIPLRTFLRLAPMRHTPAPPDTELAFLPEPLPGAPAGRWNLILPVWLTELEQPSVLVANDKEVRLTGAEAALPAQPITSDGVLPLDWNNEYRTGLLLAGREGLRFYQQQKDGSFTDVTASTGLPPDVLGGDYAAAWTADVDMDGALDIILARSKGPPLLLRNNSEGTFTSRPIFPEVDGARSFAWADLDSDGAPDAALLDAVGQLHVYANDRSGRFREWPAGPPNDHFLALAVADTDGDGMLNLVALRADGALAQFSDRDRRSAWDARELAHWDSVPDAAKPGEVRLLAADLDNNGVLDLVVSGPKSSQAWLGTGGGRFQPLAAALPPRLFAAADLNGGGRLDLLGVDEEGRPVRLVNDSRKGYHWLAVRLRARPGFPEPERINSFGLGSEIELRTGTYLLRQAVTAPVVHFGLGRRSRTQADVLRIAWPNGTADVHINRPIDQAILVEQILVGW
jgi:tetratricopeptide (TPR) repeat protein